MEKEKKILKKPGKLPSIVENVEKYELFSTFYNTAGGGDLSNTIELWDAIPKYFVSKKEQNKLRTKDGFLGSLSRDFQIKFNHADSNDENVYVDCSVKIEPALIEKDGEELAFYPAEKEELVESVLRKFFEDQALGIYDAKKRDAWVRFTLSGIRNELESRGHSASIAEIKESIDILSSTKVSFYIKGEQVYKDSIVSSLVKVDRKKYENDSSSHWACKLPALISEAIEHGKYSQFDYSLGMSLQTPLARWLHQLLARRYIQASSDHWYDIYFATVKKNSGYLDAGDKQGQIRKLEKAIDELIKAEVLQGEYEKNAQNDNKKIANIRYRVLATHSFEKKMKASNKRKADYEKRITELDDQN